MLIIKALHNLLMCKDTTLFPEFSKEKDFSFEKTSCGKKIRIDFNAPDLSSNGGLILFQGMDCGLLDKIADCIPDWRLPELIHHTIRDMVRQRVGQIACGYEDANDCDALRHDSALKMLAGRKPSDADLCSQPTMTRLENQLNSTCKCNRIIVNNLFKFFVWREVSKPFTRSIIEDVFNSFDMFVGYFTKIRTLWDVLPN